MDSMDDMWFTSDHHFGHKRIIELCDRPYSDIKEHDEDLIARWNSVVSPSDQVYHLGDFTLNNDKFAAKIFERLNGNIHILGTYFHHDHRWLPKTELGAPALWESHGQYVSNGTEYRQKFVDILQPMVALKPNPLSVTRDGEDGFYGPPIILCHYPIAQWDRKHYGAWHLYGHTHQAGNDVVLTRFSLNVGVDAWDYKPVSLKQVHEHMVACGWHDGWKEF